LGERVRLTRAIREVLTSPHLLPVLLVWLAVGLLSEAPGRLPYAVVPFAVNVLLSGYAISYARSIATGEVASLPPLGDVITYIRRGAALTLVVLLPLLVLGAPEALVSWLASSFGADGSAITAVAVLVGGVLSLVAGIVALPVLTFPVIVGARYAFYDRLLEGLRYVDAMKRAWRFRRAAAAAVTLGVAGGVSLFFVRYGFAILLHSSMLRDFGDALRLLAAGRFSVRSFGVVIAILAVHLLSTLLMLIGGNVIGQYGRIAYGSDSEAVGGWSNQGIEQPASAAGGTREE
jgi:hypothetical protein